MMLVAPMKTIELECTSYSVMKITIQPPLMNDSKGWTDSVVSRLGEVERWWSLWIHL